jgi:hypothetical protein
MLKLLIKVAIAGLIANATWRLGSAYLQFYQFQDAVTEVAQFGREKSAPDLERRVLEIASQYDVPLDVKRLTVQRDDRSHTMIDGSYEQTLDLLPGYRYPWQFTMHVDVLTLGSLK